MPLDHSRTRGRKIELALTRLPAADAAQRRGVLLTNPGGPGGSGTFMPEYVAFLLAAYPAVMAQYDIVGFDPRFVGESTPVTCGLTGSDITLFRWPGPGGFAADVAATRSVAQACQRHAGWAIPFATTEDAARDMDLIRAAMGERRVSYLGYSYGTTLGRAYMALFPQRVDRFVLDSNTHPTRTGRDAYRQFGQQFERMLWQFSGFAADGGYGLGEDARSVRATFEAILARAAQAPIESGELTFSLTDIREITFRLLYAENRFDWLARFLVAMRDAQPLPADIEFLANVRGWETPPPIDNGIATFFLIACADDAWPRDPGRYERELRIDSRLYPFVGPPFANIWTCAFWPRLDRSPSTVDGSRVPALLINSTGDPATPYDGAVATRRMMPNSRLVSVPVSHHAVLGEYPSPCVEQAAVAYLTEGLLRDRSCPATPEPELTALQARRSLPRLGVMALG
ncbi:alpha/beta hydrolase [Rhizocola hellebori]|uniref:Alpha/beta hydrolase n=1 Tax=Rhizocola hellebori TaxID=1392758 RepID=A0A8J3VG81_9ACTN|nr:alpha/beta hydrolase [Rhizocola hellebori]GIH06069.1 alpha/beta hydrolase [Rhizocola hellebori]